MTPDDAFKVILRSRLDHGLMSDSLAVDRKTAKLIIDALEALGLIKFEEPPQTMVIGGTSWQNREGCVQVRIDTMVSALRNAGYRVEKA